MSSNEGSVQNLAGSQAIAKMKELIEHGRSCLMHTALDKRPTSVRPMGPLKVTKNGELLFFSDRNSRKNTELAASPEMQLTFSNDGDNEYMNLYGKAEVYRDQQQIDELYNLFANTWFEGKEDPDLTIIRFTPTEGHYWDSKHGKIFQMAAITFGAITGKQTDDGLQGDLKL